MNTQLSILSNRIMTAMLVALLGLSSCLPGEPLSTTGAPTAISTRGPVEPATETATAGDAAPLTSTPSIAPPVVNCFELLQQGGWIMEGAANREAQPAYFQEIDGLLQDQEVLQIIIDIHGASFGEGDLKDESAILIDQPEGQWTVASLATHGLENGKEGPQAVYIDLGDFVRITRDGGTGGVLDLSQPYGPLHARFWSETAFTVEISSIMACNYQRV